MWDWITTLANLRNESRPAALMTVSRTIGSAPREVGAKMIVCSDGTAFGTIGGGHIEQLAVKEALDPFLGPPDVARFRFKHQIVEFRKTGSPDAITAEVRDR